MALFSESPSLGRIVHYVMEDADYLKEGAYAAANPGSESNRYKPQPKTRTFNFTPMLNLDQRRRLEFAALVVLRFRG